MKPIRLIRLPTADAGHERAAVVSIETAGSGVMVRVAMGTTFASLTGGTAYGPYAPEDVDARVADAIQKLKSEGFQVALFPDLVTALGSKSPGRRGRAALRLGWRREKEAVAALLIAAENAKGDICPIVDALGWIGDPAAIEVARGLAQKKNLSRRRSGVEALRNLGDGDGLAQARQAAQARFPAEVLEVLSTADEGKVKKVDYQRLVKVIEGGDPRRRGLIADLLYERDTPLCNRVARDLFDRKHLSAPHQWRYAKSVLKRSMLRHDPVVFGWLAYSVDRCAKQRHIYKGVQATLKSGLDGKKRSMRVFAPHTQDYVRRATWRYLRDLAKWRPELYTAAAAQAIVHYEPEDAAPPKGRYGGFAHAHLLNRVLYDRSARLSINYRTLKFRFVAPGAAKRPTDGTREEAFPELWDAHPEPFLAILAKAKLVEVLDFALAGLRRHPEILREASANQLFDIFGRQNLAASKLVAEELERRFDPATPDWDLVDRALRRVAATPALREIVSGWLTATAPVWARDPARTLRYLLAEDSMVRRRVAEALIPVLASIDVAARAELANAIFEKLTTEEPEPGRYSALARVGGEALSSELEGRLGPKALMEWIQRGSGSAKQLAGMLLGKRKDALEIVGLAGLAALGDHEVAAVRAAAQHIVRGATQALRKDPSPLYALAESRWDDTRDAAFELLRELGLAVLGLDGVIGLCDSTDPRVQDLGKS
ncbi:MAG: HEAT repeat domain-containing protein, partial [Myxococcota bacterium]